MKDSLLSFIKKRSQPAKRSDGQGILQTGSMSYYIINKIIQFTRSTDSSCLQIFQIKSVSYVAHRNQVFGKRHVPSILAPISTSFQAQQLCVHCWFGIPPVCTVFSYNWLNVWLCWVALKPFRVLLTLSSHFLMSSALLWSIWTSGSVRSKMVWKTLSMKMKCHSFIEGRGFVLSHPESSRPVAIQQKQ